MLAVSAWLDDKAESAVRGVWEKMAAAGVDSSLHDGPYRPHITLGVWEDVKIDPASCALTSLADRTAAFAARFPALGVYPGDDSRPEATAGVYLAPPLSRELRELHEAVHSAIDEVGERPLLRYTPGQWEPHCTLAWRLSPDALSRAVETALDVAVLPLMVTVNRIGLIDTPAEVELGSFPLAAPRIPPHP